jgi:hypothetical protein
VLLSRFSRPIASAASFFSACTYGILEEINAKALCRGLFGFERSFFEIAGHDNEDQIGRRDHELWVIAGFAFKKDWRGPLPLRLRLNEQEFAREASKAP